MCYFGAMLIHTQLPEAMQSHSLEAIYESEHGRKANSEVID